MPMLRPRLSKSKPSQRSELYGNRCRLISTLKFREKALGPEGFLSEHKVDDALRFLVLSPSAAPLVNETFAAISATHQVAEKQALGELRDVHAAGYANFFGMAGLHRFFHTPADDPRTTSPEILEPVARAFADAVRKTVERGQRAFK